MPNCGREERNLQVLRLLNSHLIIMDFSIEQCNSAETLNALQTCRIVALFLRNREGFGRFLEVSGLVLTAGKGFFIFRLKL